MTANYTFMQIALNPIATKTNKRETPTGDFWGDTIFSHPDIPEADKQ